MKTQRTERNLQPLWQAASDEKVVDGVKIPAKDRQSLPPRKVVVTEFATGADIVEFMGGSARHVEELVKLINAQLHIRFGSACGRAYLLNDHDKDDPIKEVRATWLEPEMIELDYIAALDEACRKEKAVADPFAKFTVGMNAETKAKFMAHMASFKPETEELL